MELAGLSVACAVFSCFAEVTKRQPNAEARVLVIIGPGNNGGDGLVAARHLRLFGVQADVVCPVEPKKELYKDLLQQAKEHEAQVFRELPEDVSDYHLIIDAIFGFGFKGAPRAPYAAILERIQAEQIPVFAVDVPSGWDVDTGKRGELRLFPAALISLTAPKKFAQNFKGIHFLGGRFLPQSLKQKYGLVLPDYQASFAFFLQGQPASSACRTPQALNPKGANPPQDSQSLAEPLCLPLHTPNLQTPNEKPVGLRKCLVSPSDIRRERRAGVGALKAEGALRGGGAKRTT
ncbi:NAD(P)H-hydrate epimerase-like [Cyclospora cayetanensis]|uniref:NAD(P)H-hydrate epimerase n=1 Tax=Cyclospora cayetanensis TaxID=88456 RepID=A0A6P6RTL8_9EIME|nr:NAD(P)H-hydrate epimerase-like [Cyclospora cayetanensis]